MDVSGVITGVIEEDNGYCVRVVNAEFILSKRYDVVPKVGDTVNVCTCQGDLIRGVCLNGHKIFYKSDDDLNKEHKIWCDNLHAEQLERFEKSKALMDKDYDSLPQVFKNRIDRFRKESPDFRIAEEAYEVFVIKEGLKIVKNVLKDEMEEFMHSDCKKQLKMCPELSQGHSSNTIGCACALAFAYLLNPEGVF